MDRNDTIRRLAADVTRSSDAPSDDLEMALGQLVDQVMTGSAGDRPIDWPSFISEAVLARHSD